MFSTIGYADHESTGFRSRPDFEKESQRFRVELRKTGFLNPLEPNHAFESLDKNNKLSEAMKSFSSTAKALRIDFIKKKLGTIKSSRITHIIPVTSEEEEKQSSENSMSKKELILIIQSLVGSLNETNHIKLKGLASKKKEELLIILQQVKDIHNGTDDGEIEEMEEMI